MGFILPHGVSACGTCISPLKKSLAAMLKNTAFYQVRTRVWSRFPGELISRKPANGLCLWLLRLELMISLQTMVNEYCAGDSLERKIILGSTNSVA